MYFKRRVVVSTVILLTHAIGNTHGSKKQGRVMEEEMETVTEQAFNIIQQRKLLENEESSAQEYRTLHENSVGTTLAFPGFPAYDPTPDDLGIRYSKVSFEETSGGGENLLPLTMEDFPLTAELGAILRQSECISVVMEDDCPECDMYTEELIDAVGGYPVHVSSNPESVFWEEFREVIHVQKQRLEGVDPFQVIPFPDIWSGPNPQGDMPMSLEDVAELVHDELPGTHHHNLIRSFIGEGFTVDRDIIPSPSTTEFLRREVMLAYLTTWAVSKVGPYNFAVKYYVGRSRPEEVAWLIAQGLLTESDGVPSDVREEIELLNLQSATDFTAYPEGSPKHPSWPAMHSAGSASSLWLPVVLNLSEEQICQTKLVDWAVSYARTVAGVHYRSDNIAGLILGQEIIARKLPGHLAHVYGSDPVDVEAKVATMRFDWNDFVESDCFQDHFGSS